MFRTAAVAVGIVGVVLFAFAVMPSGVQNALNTLATPLWTAGDILASPFQGVSSYFSVKRGLERENNELKDTVRKHNLRLIELDLLRQENERLLSLWNRSISNEAVLGRVIAGPPTSAYGTFVIDVGAREGVAVGDYVAFESVMLGEIVEVFSHSARVQLFSASGKLTEVRIGAERTLGEARGKGSGNFVIQLPRDLEIARGDTVVFAPTGRHMLGEIGGIQTGSSDPFQTLLVAYPLNIRNVEWVEVLVKGSRLLPEVTEEDETS